MMKPTVHLNGTSKKDLFEGYAEAAGAIRTAIGEVRQAGPNARDYYPQGPDAFYKAQDEHTARLAQLKKVLDEIEELCESVGD